MQCSSQTLWSCTVPFFFRTCTVPGRLAQIGSSGKGPLFVCPLAIAHFLLALGARLVWIRDGRAAAQEGLAAGQGTRLQSGKVTAPGSHPIGTVGGDPTMANSHALDLRTLGRGPTRAQTAARISLPSPGEHLAIAVSSWEAASWTAALFPLAADRHISEEQHASGRARAEERPAACPAQGGEANSGRGAKVAVGSKARPAPAELRRGEWSSARGGRLGERS